MKSAAKVFIWIGMIIQFFLIYPLVIGIIALKQIKKAQTRADLKGIGIIVTLFCSLLGGIFMLCIEDDEFQKSSKVTDSPYTNITPYTDLPQKDFNVTVPASTPKIPDISPIKSSTSTTSSPQVLPSSTRITKSNVQAKPNTTKTIGIIFTILFLAFSMLIFIVAFSNVRVSINKENFTPSINYALLSGCMLISIVFAVIAVLFFAYAVFPSSSKPKEKRMTAIVILCLFLFAFFAITTAVGITSIKRKTNNAVAYAKRQASLQIPDYTDITIADFLIEAERYPSKYNGTTITLEGYATSCGINKFRLKFPDTDYYTPYIDVIYNSDDTHPRVLEGDYVVVSGIVRATPINNSYNPHIFVEIIDATCEIKNIPNQ